MNSFRTFALLQKMKSRVSETQPIAVVFSQALSRHFWPQQVIHFTRTE